MLMMLKGFWKLGRGVVADAHNADGFLEACHGGIAADAHDAEGFLEDCQGRCS